MAKAEMSCICGSRGDTKPFDPSTGSMIDPIDMAPVECESVCSAAGCGCPKVAAIIPADGKLELVTDASLTERWERDARVDDGSAGMLCLERFSNEISRGMGHVLSFHMAG